MDVIDDIPLKIPLMLVTLLVSRLLISIDVRAEQLLNKPPISCNLLFLLEVCNFTLLRLEHPANAPFIFVKLVVSSIGRLRFTRLLHPVIRSDISDAHFVFILLKSNVVKLVKPLNSDLDEGFK